MHPISVHAHSSSTYSVGEIRDTSHRQVLQSCGREIWVRSATPIPSTIARAGATRLEMSLGGACAASPPDGAVTAPDAVRPALIGRQLSPPSVLLKIPWVAVPA